MRRTDETPLIEKTPISSESGYDTSHNAVPSVALLTHVAKFLKPDAQTHLSLASENAQEAVNAFNPNALIHNRLTDKLLAFLLENGWRNCPLKIDIVFKDNCKNGVTAIINRLPDRLVRQLSNTLVRQRANNEKEEPVETMLRKALLQPENANQRNELLSALNTIIDVQPPKTCSWKKNFFAPVFMAACNAIIFYFIILYFINSRTSTLFLNGNNNQPFWCSNPSKDNGLRWLKANSLSNLTTEQISNFCTLNELICNNGTSLNAQSLRGSQELKDFAHCTSLFPSFGALSLLTASAIILGTASLTASAYLYNYYKHIVLVNRKEERNLLCGSSETYRSNSSFFNACETAVACLNGGHAITMPR